MSTLPSKSDKMAARPVSGNAGPWDLGVTLLRLVEFNLDGRAESTRCEICSMSFKEY